MTVSMFLKIKGAKTVKTAGHNIINIFCQSHMETATLINK